MTLFANARYFSTWAVSGNSKGNGRSRHDYDCPEHLIADMLNEDYWGTLLNLLEAGDLVHVTDAENGQAVLRIDWTDDKLRRVGLSVQERITERAIVGTDGYAIKNRGPRGGFWSVLDEAGCVLSKDHRTREDAERARDALKLAKAA